MVVTGGASGIGAALVRQHAARGDVVYVADRDLARARALAAELGERAHAVELDVSRAEAFEAVLAQVLHAQGRVDRLYNNAGINVIGDALLATDVDIQRLLDVNMRSVLHGSLAAYRLMARQGHGTIVNTASAQGLGPAPAAALYTATKHGVVGFSLALRTEALSRHVQVCVACPGFVDTPIRDNTVYRGLDRQQFEQASMLRPITADKCAAVIVQGADRGRAIIVIGWETRLLWWAMRALPTLTVWVMSKVYTWRFRSAKAAA